MKNVSSFLQSMSVVIITGGSSGIGESILKAISHYKPEMRFFNLSRSSVEINLKNLTHIPCDLSDSAELTAALGVLKDGLKTVPQGKILLINNAGYGLYGLVPQMDKAGLLGMLDLNNRAMVQLTLELLPQMIERGGGIINVSSIAAYVPTPTLAVYGATKAFVLSWGMALREELKAQGINVLTVCPGPTATKFFSRAGFEKSPLPPVIGRTPDFVAKRALNAAAKNRALITTGWTNKLLRWVCAVVPRELGVPISFGVLKFVRLRSLKK